ncbi:LysR family transcriptional regulator [Tannockella kyphosi]|uniref:LysR family transcriptional regulator n=1 Tax=Tannockella kyphosi TaxID=2899121 RepID=UPI002013394F|nr:LysR family transcriptional regulator [Tannockella kyphosi]
MTLKHLKIFIAVCQTGTLTAAGKKLFIAQPAISVAISDLESHYGVKLFDRINNRLHITEVGKQFLQYAQHIIDLHEEMEYNIMNSDGLGTLKIGSSITIANCYLPAFVQALKTKNPELLISITVQNSGIIESKIVNNELDIALIEGVVSSPFVQSTHFLEDPLVLVVPKDHPFANKKAIQIYDLNNQNFLTREKGSAGREVLDGLVETYSLSIHFLLESISTQAIINSIKSGLGISILPFLLVKEDIEKGELIQVAIKDVKLKRDLSIIYHKNKFLSKAAKDLMEISIQKGA